MKKVKDLKKWIELYNEVKAAADEVQLAYEYVKEEIVSEEELDAEYAKAISLIENLEFRNMYERFAAVLGGAQDSFDLFGEAVEQEGYCCTDL